MDETTPLLVRPAIIDGEMLVSFLFRLSLVNHYEPPNLLIRHGLGKNRVSEIVGRRVSLIQDPMIFARLSRLTGTHQRRLYEATAHQFADLITPPDVQISSVTLSSKQKIPILGAGIADKQLRSEYASQFCPFCLEERTQFPLIWMPVAVSSCIKHECVLAVACKGCGKNVGILEIVRKKCKRCGYDLRNTPTRSIKNDKWGFTIQKRVQHWLNSMEQPPGHDVLQLPDQPVRVIYRVLDGLRQVIQSHPSMVSLHTFPGQEGISLLRNHMTRRRISPTESYILYATAMTTLSNWPSRFHDFLESFAGHSGEASTLIINQRFGLLNSNWLQEKWAHPQFDFVQKSFDKYILETPIAANSLCQLDRYRQGKKSPVNYRYISLSEAAHTLKISTKAVRKLIMEGHLENALPGDSNSTSGSVLLLRGDISKLSEKWNSAITLKSAMDILGLNRAITLDLALEGEIDIVRGPTFDGYRVWRLDRGSVERYLNKILASVRSNSSSGEMVDLTGALHLTANVGLHAVGLLSRVSQGDLPIYRVESRGSAKLQGLTFVRNDIIRLCDTIVQEKGWVRKQDIMNLLQIGRKIVGQLIRSGSLNPSSICNNICYFDKTAIMEFCNSNLDGPKG